MNSTGHSAEDSLLLIIRHGVRAQAQLLLSSLMWRYSVTSDNGLVKRWHKIRFGLHSKFSEEKVVPLNLQSTQKPLCLSNVRSFIDRHNWLGRSILRHKLTWNYFRQRWKWIVWGDWKAFCQCQGTDGAVLHWWSANVHRPNSCHTSWVPAEVMRSCEQWGQRLHVLSTQLKIRRVMVFPHPVCHWGLRDHPWTVIPTIHNQLQSIVCVCSLVYYLVWHC